MKFTLTPTQRAAASKAPDIMARHIEGALDRASQEIARSMQQRVSAHDLFGTLKASIRPVKSGRFERTVAPGVIYARYLEEGTGPAAGRAAYFPSPDVLMVYVATRARRASLAARPGRKALHPVEEIKARAWALARSIAKRGTRPHPFVRPTARTMAPCVRELLEGAVRNALKEIADGRAL